MGAPIGSLGRGDGLGQIQAAAEEEIKKRFKLCPFSAAEALAAKADDVQSGDAVDALGAAEVGDVLAERAIALDDTRVTNAQELVKHSTAADEGAITDTDMTGEESGIGDNVVGADLDIMPEVATDHEKII